MVLEDIMTEFTLDDKQCEIWICGEMVFVLTFISSLCFWAQNHPESSRNHNESQ